MTATAPAATTEEPTQPQLPQSRLEADAQVLKPWKPRLQQARTDRRLYERQWMINQNFAAGVQHLRWNDRDHRVLAIQKTPKGRLLDTVDVLSQYNGTAIGKVASGDFRPELLCAWQDDRAAEDANDYLNEAVSYAWDEEIKADSKIRALLRCLVELGTGAIRVRYDRSTGPLVADEYPHLHDKPVIDPGQARSLVAAAYAGQAQPGLKMKPLREGRICWEKLSSWNLLPPPGIEDPDDFPWEIVVRPILIDDLKGMYGARAANVREDSLDEMGMLIYQNAGVRPFLNGDSWTPATVTNLKAHALTYTGYARPSAKYPQGQTVVWAQDSLLDVEEALPLNDAPYGPRSGITYFRWTALEGRFWGRAFMEPGIGPQKIRNKRRSQQDETIDKSHPKVFAEEGSFSPGRITGVPFEVVWLKTGASKPQVDAGVVPPWLGTDIEQIDSDIQQALGLKGTSLGAAPAGVSAYSAMALLTENDATKLDPVAGDIRLGIADCTRDTVETMKQWPQSKKLYISGPQDGLKVEAWDSQKAIPAAYKCRPAKGGTLPRSQAAEVQKIADVANYAATIGVAQADPDDWMDWYVRSLNAGDLQDLPQTNSQVEQRHRAAMENSLMSYGSPAPPVAPYDDPTIHEMEHAQQAGEVQTEIAYAQQSDPSRVAGLQHELAQINLHRQLHLQVAQQNGAANGAAGAPGAPGAPAAPAGPPGAAAPGDLNLPPERYINTLQTPRLPYAQPQSDGFR